MCAVQWRAPTSRAAHIAHYSVVQRGVSAPPAFARGQRFSRKFKGHVNPRDGSNLFEGVVVHVEKRLYQDWFKAYYEDGDIQEISAGDLHDCIKRYGNHGIAVGEELADCARKYEAEAERRKAERARQRRSAEHNMAIDEQKDQQGGTGGDPLSPPWQQLPPPLPRQAGPGQGVGSAATAQHTGVDDGTSTCMEIGGHAVLSTACEGGTTALSVASDAVPAQQGPAQGIDTTRPVVLSAMAAAPPSQGPEQPGSAEHSTEHGAPSHGVVGAASFGDGPGRTQADAIGSAEGGKRGKRKRTDDHPWRPPTGATAGRLREDLPVNAEGIARLITASIQALEETGYTLFSREDAYGRTPFLLC